MQRQRAPALLAFRDATQIACSATEVEQLTTRSQQAPIAVAFRGAAFCILSSLWVARKRAKSAGDRPICVRWQRPSHFQLQRGASEKSKSVGTPSLQNTIKIDVSG